MCKKSVENRNNERIRLSALHKSSREFLKKAIKLEQDSEKKQALVIKLDNMNVNSSESRIRNRCKETGRPRGFIGYFGICRMMLRAYAHLIPGLRKGSW